MPAAPAPLVLFHVAAGPRLGFGHLVRCGVLARALGGRARLSLHGTAATRRVARRRGWILADRGVRALAPEIDLLVVDDPSALRALTWVRRAHRRGLRVATFHDMGIGRVASDLTIDGSLAPARDGRRADLQGPRYAVLGSRPGAARRRSSDRRPLDVVVALGGGAHVRRLGARLARAIRQSDPRARVAIAAGLTGLTPPVLPAGCRWLPSSADLATALGAATVAVAAGGLTLQEACALGTPVVATAVVPAQRPAIRAWAAAGAVLDAGRATRPQDVTRVAALVAALLADPRRRVALGRRARRLIDADGATRVARALRALVAGTQGREVRRAA
ncbi:MAG: glycosyltransferase [Vicinamibacterales bacterium]